MVQPKQKTHMVTAKYRLRPDKRHHRRLEEILESQRLLYNAALEERIDKYKKTGVGASYNDQCESLTECRRDLPEMAALPAAIQRGTIDRVDKVFEVFSRRVRENKAIRQANKSLPKNRQIPTKKPGFPRFKGKGRFKSISFREMNGITYSDKRLNCRAFGSIRVLEHRPLPEGAEIGSVSI